MATTKFNLFKQRNVKNEKQNKGKKKVKKESSHFDPRFDPYMSARTPKALFHADINSFWKYSPRNPFSIQKVDKYQDPNCVTINSTSPTFIKPKRKIPPRFNSVTSAGNMSSILSRRENDNTAAVIEARREIEKIKTELETLISANIKTQSYQRENITLIPEELPEIESLLNTAADACKTLADTTPETNEPEPVEPVKIIPPKPVVKTSFMSSPSPTRKKIAPPFFPEESTAFEAPRPKSRTYDPEKTREFIKKQKLRRKEKLLEEEQKKQQKEFARKIKLEELKKKTLEIVSKNLKKSTSKSAKSPSDVNANNTPKSNAQIDNNKTKNKFSLLQSRRCRARSFDHANRDKDTTDNKRSRSVSREINSKKSNQKIPENQMLVGTKSQVTLQSSSQKSLTPKVMKKAPLKKETTKIDSPPKIIDINEINQTSLSSTKENIMKTTTESPKTQQNIISVNVTTSNNTKQNGEQQEKEQEHEHEHETNAAKELTEIKQKLETSITQLKEKNDIPIWLQPPSSVPYPYNFISAVRKKLEYVTRKPSKIDRNDENNKLNVSIQCSIDKKILDVNSVNIPKLVSPVKMESPRHRTYESHKCRRQLYPNTTNIPQRNPQETKTNEIEININKTDSDSDTTKNIPELPHEDPIKNMTKCEENKKNITFDKSKDNFSRNTSKLSLASDISERLKNITFERNIPPKLNMGEIKLPLPDVKKYAALIPPEDKIEIPPKAGRKSRSKYPDDIDSILSHYSRIKSEQNSYSDDFNSLSGSGSSKHEKPSTKTESITEYKQIPSGFVSLSRSATISEHLPPPQTYSNSSSKENIFVEENTKKTISSSAKSRVSTETNRTMKDVPSLSSKQSNTTIGTVDKTESNSNSNSNQIKTDSSAIRTVSNTSNFHLEHNESEEKFVDMPQLKKITKLTKPEVVLKRRTDEIENNPNHIHLKLQAEVHLLNSFNNSLKQVVAVEKSVFDVPSTSTFNPINCKRGCDFPDNNAFNKNTSKMQNVSNTSLNDDGVYDDKSICSQDLGMSNIIDRSSMSTTVATNSIISRREENLDFKSHPYVAISLDMVDQMIKDEDIRLEHLKAVLKLRDQALFDRIKGELALLEIRKRELREHGQTNDITAIKKKQRGLIIKLQQERHEMHRLKTAHKQAAKARKSALHEQKSIIKTQLSSTDQIPKKLRRLSQLERPSLGPVKVYRVDSRTEVSETTLSRKGSDDSVTNSSVLTQISEKISVEKSEIFYSDSLAVVEPVKNKQSGLQSEKLKRSLLMKEAEIDKRRKEIEELIKWQKRLKQKEAEVVELERQAVKSLQSDDQEKVRVFTGAHLNKVWKGIALPDKNFDEQKKYQMSKRSLDKFYQNARRMFKEVSDEEKRTKTTESYSSEFEQTNLSNSVASLNELEVQTKMVADRLRHISDIISVPDANDHKSNTSSEDISSIQEDNKSASACATVSYSVSESPSVKTEVNTLVKSDSIHSEFIDSLRNKSSPSKSLELIIASETSAQKPGDVSESLKTDSLERTHSKSTVAEILESIKSDVVSAGTGKTTILSEVSEKHEPQVLETIDSLNSSAKSDSISKSILSEASDKTESRVLENIISGSSTEKQDSTPKSILEVSEKSESQILENIHSLNSSAKSDSISKSIISEASDKSEPQIHENIDSLNSSVKSEINTSEPKSTSELEQPSSELEQPSEKSELQIPDNIEILIQENIESTNSSATSEINSVEHKSSSELEEVSEKSEQQIQEIVDSHNSSLKSETDTPQIQEHIAADDIPISESLEKSTTPSPQENIITSEKSSKIESWEPQIISEIKSDESSENEIKSNKSLDTIKSELEVNSAVVDQSSNVDSKIFEEPETKSKTNSETHVSEQNVQTDATAVTTPRSEVQYETDFDKFSESDQSKIETESNVSLKETNVDSSINEEESEDGETSGRTLKTPTTSIKSEANKEITENTQNTDVSEASNKIASESSGVSEHSSNTIKVSPKEPESKILSEKSEILDNDDDDDNNNKSSGDSDDLNDSKKGVSHIDVRKRVSEILADANGPRGDKSPRVQDLYTTTYDIAGSSETTPESGSPTNEFSKQEKTSSFSPETPYINEAEELLRKQLEIEQEIKRLERQQQNIPYLFMREIPNKPPPPYKPPDFPLTPVISSIIPSKPEQTKKIINDATAILFDAYTTGDLAKTSSGSKDDQQRFMFDLCKEIAIEACKPTIETTQKTPSWRSQKNKFQNLFAKRPITKDLLNSVLNKKVLQLLNFEPIARNDSLIIRWSRKKRDHVDEILVSETQAEEAEWTNFDSDEEIIKDNLTQNILDLLIVDAANDVNAILMKKKKMDFCSWSNC